MTQQLLVFCGNEIFYYYILLVYVMYYLLWYDMFYRPATDTRTDIQVLLDFNGEHARPWWWSMTCLGAIFVILLFVVDNNSIFFLVAGVTLFGVGTAMLAVPELLSLIPNMRREATPEMLRAQMDIEKAIGAGIISGSVHLELHECVEMKHRAKNKIVFTQKDEYAWAVV
jgi:hypothetical protein